MFCLIHKHWVQKGADFKPHFQKINELIRKLNRGADREARRKRRLFFLIHRRSAFFSVKNSSLLINDKVENIHITQKF
jgi:hypothetical protein